ncbi:MAG: BatD family protein [Bacteroidaceae bacterium]
MHRIYFLLLLFVALSAHSQVSVEATIDSVQIYVGEQAHITVKASADAGKKITFPSFKEKEIVSGLEVIEESKVDTQQLNDGKRLQLTKVYTVTAFDSAFFYLPPFQILVEKSKYPTKNLALKVFTMDVDTLHTDQFFGPKEIMDAPFSWVDWKSVFFKSVFLLFLFVVVVYLCIRINDNKPIVRRVTVAPSIPPHQWAMKEIEKIKTDTDLKEENSKDYYTKLTDTIRTYIQRRYDFNAREMTTAEIIDTLLKLKDKDSLEELRDLLTTADMVKFAKYNALANENDTNLIKAVDFINSTKQEVVVPEKPKPNMITIEEKRNKNVTLGMKMGIGLGCISILILCYYIGKEIYNLIF